MRGTEGSGMELCQGTIRWGLEKDCPRKAHPQGDGHSFYPLTVIECQAVAAEDSKFQRTHCRRKQGLRSALVAEFLIT